ncbi:transcriptional regulator [Massilia sp. Root351]|jgi:predicted ArsR family transcriptional regulator|uniref:helix-turn-helix transcriptional regulator n=1 Tax=Massilia sp. Root351 TaxID=1736522 RepID=UPI00070A1714|nr:metalloregulator ArsR/SmtB family transcription factor [Massilia sp. Root351]KQV86285.1 transcriptional regulator [Massilia sp. Root351]
MNTADNVLFLLKTRGPQTAQKLAELLELTSMGARRQLESAQEKGLVGFEDVADKVGRPSRRWHLTEAGHARFPDRHADLTLQMIHQVRALFGEEGMDKLIAAREQESEAAYQAALAQAEADAGPAEAASSHALASRVSALARARDAEGYMAETEVQPDGSLLLIENHCPICAAATSCQGFCRSELQVFQRVLGKGCQVERAEHLLSGARRCVYVIRQVG